MADYDPRTDTGIPTENVGSLPRPAKLQEAYAKFDAGEIEESELEELQDAAAKDSIEQMEATGSPIVSDGEQRWSSFATYPIATTLAGTGLAPMLGPGGQFFAIFADGHGRQLPKLLSGPFAYNQYAADALRKSIRFASKPMKQAVIAPSMLALLYPLKDPVEGYSREEFEAALVDECEKDIRQAFAAGAARVSVDFTEGRLATREDPRNPWTGAGLLPHFIELINGVMARFSAEERTNIGVHTCPGGDRDSVHSADVPYNNLLSTMFDINAGYFLIQLASERDRDPVYETIGKNLRSDADGVAQMAYLGHHRHAVAAGRVGAGDRRPAHPGRELHRQEPDRLHRRLRLLAVLHRREAQPRLARLRPRGGVRQDQVARRGLAYGGGQAGHLTRRPGRWGGGAPHGPGIVATLPTRRRQGSRGAGARSSAPREPARRRPARGGFHRGPAGRALTLR